MESRALFWTGRRERKLSLFGLHPTDWKQRVLQFSFLFTPPPSITPLPSNMHFSSLFSKTQPCQSQNDFVCCLSLWVNELWSPTQPHSHTELLIFLVLHIHCRSMSLLSSLQSVSSVGLSGCYLCPLSLRKRGQDTKSFRLVREIVSSQ